MTNVEISIGGPSWTEVAIAVGTSAGSLAVAIGVVVAYFQLGSIRDNAVISATIEYLARFTTPVDEIEDGVALSPAVAINRLAHILSTADRRANYRKDAKGFFDGTLRRSQGDASAEKFRGLSGGVIVAGNYFLIAESLIRRKRLDKELFFESYANKIVLLWKFVETFSDDDGNSGTLYRHLRFKGFAEEALGWYQAEVTKMVALQEPEQSPAGGT